MFGQNTCFGLSALLVFFVVQTSAIRFGSVGDPVHPEHVLAAQPPSPPPVMMMGRGYLRTTTIWPQPQLTSDADFGSLCNVAGMFKCHDGECVSVYDLCDAVRDCDDGSDEEDCDSFVDPFWSIRSDRHQPRPDPCEERSQGRCKNGRCVYKFSDCTGRDACGDGFRNANCTMCRASGWLCPDKRCIHSDERCNGNDACGDGSSDLDCKACASGAMLLPSKRCVRTDDVCSGFDVSGDMQSDSNCTTCKAGAWLCANKRCIRAEWKCTGEDMCGDNSNNKNCTRCRNMATLDKDVCKPAPRPLPHGHHPHSPAPSSHHHFAYGVVIGILGLLVVVSVSVIALYLKYPSRFRWLHRRGETGLVM